MKFSPPRWLVRTVLLIPAVPGGVVFGAFAGDAVARLTAAITDHDIASLKDMLIWSSLTGMAVGLLAAIWLVLHFTSAHKTVQRLVAIALGVVALGGGLMIASSNPPKSSGTLVIQYALRLPAAPSLPTQGEIDLTIWNDKMGQGCYIADIRMADGRPEITGTIVLNQNNTNPTMSLQLNRDGVGYWRLPYRPDTPLEKSFTPWQRIEFIPTPRAGVPPLPAGDYEIRYRARR